MSFNKYYIQEPAKFAELVKLNGPKQTVNRKIDAIIGSPLSIDMFELIEDSLDLGMSESEVNELLAEKYPEYFGQSN